MESRLPTDEYIERPYSVGYMGITVRLTTTWLSLVIRRSQEPLHDREVVLVNGDQEGRPAGDVYKL